MYNNFEKQKSTHSIVHLLESAASNALRTFSNCCPFSSAATSEVQLQPAESVASLSTRRKSSDDAKAAKKQRKSFTSEHRVEATRRIRAEGRQMEAGRHFASSGSAEGQF
jgi:hypothetical protein